jgi:hypothetical protein
VTGVLFGLVTLLDVNQGYLDTLGMRLARGRAFNEFDGTPGHESAIDNQRFVAMHFGTGMGLRAAVG